MDEELFDHLDFERVKEKYAPYLLNFEEELEIYKQKLSGLQSAITQLHPDSQIQHVSKFQRDYVSGFNRHADWSTSDKPRATLKSLLLGILIYGWTFHGAYARESGISGFWVQTPYELIHQIFFLWLLEKEQLGALAFPRKVGKTTSEKIFISWCATTIHMKYIVWVGDTDENICLHLSNVKDALEQNLMISNIFGPIKSNQSTWKENEIRTLTGFHLIVKSKRSPFRGLLDDSVPDLIIVDDIDNDEEKYSPILRNKLDEKLDTALHPVVSHIGKIRYVGTIVYDDCIIDRRLKNKLWHPIILHCWVAIDQEDSIAPNVLPTWFLLQKRDELFNAKPVPKPHVWYSEYMNMPRNAMTQKFDIKKLRYWEGYYQGDILHLMDGRKIKVRVTTAVDLAGSEGSAKTDSTVVFTTGTDSESNFYGLKLWRRHNAKPSEIVDEICSQADEYGTREVHLELISTQDFLMESWRIKQKQRGSMPVLHTIKHRRHDKDSRLKGAIMGNLDLGRIWIKKGDIDQRALEQEMDNYLSPGSHDDCLDTLADNITFSQLPTEDKKTDDPYSNRPMALRPNTVIESNQGWMF